MLFIIARTFDLGGRFGELRSWIDSLGMWGPLAFIGCVSGALMKDAYLAAIEGVGFTNVIVKDEAEYGLDFLANDPSVNTMIQKSGATKEQLKEYEHSVVSLKVEAKKP